VADVVDPVLVHELVEFVLMSQPLVVGLELGVGPGVVGGVGLLLSEVGLLLEVGDGGLELAGEDGLFAEELTAFGTQLS